MSGSATLDDVRASAPRSAHAPAPHPEPQMPSFWQRLDQTGVPLLAARLILGGMFLWMGFHKISDPVGFLKQVRMYQMVPEGTPFLLNSIAIVLPWMEVTTGAALILGMALRGAGLIQLGMLVVFTGAVFLRAMKIWNTEGTPFFEIAFDCGCGSGVVIIWTKLLTNVGLCLLTIIPILSRSRRFCLGR